MHNVRFVKALASGDAVVSERTATVLVVASGVSAASIAFFARSLTDAGLSAGAIVFFRFAATVAVTGRNIVLTENKRSASTWAFAAGMAVGLGWVTYVLAIERLDVATAGAIYMTYPVFALAASSVIVRRRPARRGLLGATLVLTGAVIAIGPPDAGFDGWMVLVAFAAPISFGVVVAVLSERVQALQPVERIAATSVGAIVALIPIVVIQPLDSVIPANGRTWLLVVGIGLLTSLLPMGCFVVGAPVVGSARAAVAGAVELPTVFVIAWVLLGEPPTFTQLVGGAVIVAAVAVSPTRPPPIATARPRPRRPLRPKARPGDPRRDAARSSPGRATNGGHVRCHPADTHSP
jgi:drug/metabolite transporter (DMT)-like permease